MNANRLSQRLTRLRTSKPSASRRRSDDDLRPPGEGWQHPAPQVWERRLDYPAIFPEGFSAGFVLPESTSRENLLFYDLETTGLSGGAGNTAFLIGMGRQTANRFTVTQFFLADYPGEPALLTCYSESLKKNDVHVSYNGLSFDSHVLKTRFLLNRIPAPETVELDLLHPARRFWKSRLPSVSLGNVEAEVLNIRRPDDMPGREAPEAWFEWLRGDARRIGAVFRHNLDDILALAQLSARMEEWGRLNPGEADFPPGCPPAACGMARQWSFHRQDRAVSWLEFGWSRGEADCGWLLALHRRRTGDFEGARAIWESLTAFDNSFPASVELAKYWEHRRRKPDRALAVLENASPPDERRGKELRHRRERLRRKADAAQQ